MKLPHAHAATIPQAKVVDYLLSHTHRAGKSKAAFFTSFGFRPEQWTQLSEALCQHAIDNDAAEQAETPYGTRYVIDGVLRSPAGDGLNVRAVWFIDRGKDVPRFVTAHPLKRKKS